MNSILFSISLCFNTSATWLFFVKVRQQYSYGVEYCCVRCRTCFMVTLTNLFTFHFRTAAIVLQQKPEQERYGRKKKTAAQQREAAK